MAFKTIEDLKKALVELISNSPYATSLDISKYQVEFDIDINQIKVILKILDAVCLRLGYSAYGTHRPIKDPKFDIFLQELFDHPEIIREFYFYVQSETSGDLEFEFITFEIDKLNNAGKEWEVLWIDFEKTNNTKSRAFAEKTLVLIDRLQSKYPNKRIGLYTNRSTYNDWLRPFIGDAYLNSIPLWIAAYPFRMWNILTDLFYNWVRGAFTNLSRKPIMPRGRIDDNWEKWQIGDRTGLGIFLGVKSSNVDINMSRRTKEDYVEWVGVPKRFGEKEEELTCNEVREELVKSVERIKLLENSFIQFSQEINSLKELCDELSMLLIEEEA